MASYWSSVQSRRLSRRRLLAATAGAGGVAVLVACGGGDGESGNGQSDSGLITPVTDDTKNLTRGGVMKAVQGVPQSLDPHQLNAGVAHVWHNYSPLFKVVEGHMERPTGEMEGELVDSWELSPDKTQLVLKITRDVAFAPLPPVNGRRVDAEDVAFSWRRYNAVSPRRAELANEANPAAPILSVEATDAQTATIKLKEPVSTILSQLAGTFAGTYFIVPKEAENPNVLDLRQVGAGSGPFYVSDVVQSASTTYKRNPGFKKDKRGIPYVEQIDYADLPEYAAQLAQLKAGNIYDTYFNFRAEDILPAKKDVPELDITPTPISGLILRGVFGVAPDSPFKDERVRQAYVLTWDRDLFLDLAYNFAKFNEGGLSVETVVESGVWSGSWEGWWLDPRSKDFGPNSKYFEVDLAEAKKLMSAAGFAGGVDTDMYYVSPQPYQQLVDMLIGMVNDSGLFRVSNKVFSAPEFNATFRNNRGQFKGAGFITDNIEAHPIMDLAAHYHSGGGRYFGGDQKVDDMLDQANREFDVKKQQQIVHELQRYEGEKHFQPRLGGGSGFRITWPALRNKGVWQGSVLRWLATVWLDPTKPPLNRS
jgi:ABC-type transport system substrate-binding protein